MVKMVDLPSRVYINTAGIKKQTGGCLDPELYAKARQMEVGDTIVVEKRRGGITSNLGKATGFKFSQRAEDYGKMRIRRVA